MITLYGIDNCDTCREARHWLEDRGTEYTFHDWRRDGIDEQRLARWLDRFGESKVVNARSRTWRELPDEARAAVESGAALAVLAEYPALIRRPILETPNGPAIGFRPEAWEELL